MAGGGGTGVFVGAGVGVEVGVGVGVDVGVGVGVDVGVGVTVNPAHTGSGDPPSAHNNATRDNNIAPLITRSTGNLGNTDISILLSTS